MKAQDWQAVADLYARALEQHRADARPRRNSRTIRSVHRSPRSSSARARAQN
jgi:hypothetical protein